MKLVYACTGHPVSVVMFYLAAALFGIISLAKLQLELLPPVKINFITVITELEGMPAEDMEEIITVPIENILSSAKGIKNISSVTKDDISSVTLEINWNTQIETAADEIRGKIDYIYPLLPVNTKRPLIYAADINDTPVLTLFILPAEGLDISSISRTVEKELKSILLRLDSVSTVISLGTSEKEIIIDIDYQIMKSLKIDIEQIAEKIAGSVFSHPTGTIIDSNREYLAVITTDIKNIDDIGNIKPGSSSITLSDIADIHESEKEKTSFFHYNGKQGIGIIIHKSGDSGAYNCSGEIRKVLPYIQNLFKNSFTVEIIDDSADLLRETLFHLFITIAAGIIAAITVLKLLLNNKRIILVTLTSLPASFFAVFIFMFFNDITLNTISLTGLAIGTGMVFDNSIIIIDALETYKADNYLKAAEYTLKSAKSAAGSTATTVIAFLPVMFIPGITGKLFSDLVLCIIVFIVSSYIVSITLIPAVYMLTLDININFQAPAVFSGRISCLYRDSLKLLNVNNFYKLILPFVLLILFSSLLFIEYEILPEPETGKTSFKVFFQPGLTNKAYADMAGEAGRRLLQITGAQNIYSQTGYDSSLPVEKGNKDTAYFTSFFTGTGISEYAAIISDYGSFKPEVNNPLASLLNKKTGKSFTFTAEQREDAVTLAEDFSESALKKIPQLKYFIDTQKNIPALKIEPVLPLMMLNNISPFRLISNLSAGITGIYAAELKDSNTGTDILVRYKREYVSDTDKLKNISIPADSANRGSIPVGNFTEIKHFYYYNQLIRNNRKPSVTVDFTGDKAAIAELAKYAASVKDLFKDTYIEELDSVKHDSIIVFLTALLFIYLFLGAQFESFTAPLCIMGVIPLSMSGSFFMLLVSGNTLNISSLIGLLIMSGTVINSAILVYSSYKDGLDIFKSAEKRLIPAAAASGTTIAALIPLAMLPQSPVQNSSALTAAGGLSAGFIAVFFIFPFFFSRVKKK